MKVDKQDKNRFYVYAYLDPRKPGKYVYGEYSFDHEPFYVGKGKGYRLFDHLDLSRLTKNSPKNSKIKKIIKETKEQPKIIKTQDKLTEEEAFNLEIELVTLIGRKDLNKGPLTNLTNAGEGTSGIIVSIEKREKLRIARTGKKASEETKKKISKFGMGRIPKEETIKKLIKKSTGRKHTQETKYKLKTLNKGKANIKVFKVTNPNGDIFYTYNGLRFFCEQNGLFSSNMLKVANGKQKHHRSWKCERISSVNKNKSNKTNTKKHKLISPTGEIFFINGLIDFCQEHNLQQSKISNVEKGIRRHHKGWKAEQINDFVAQ